MNAIAKTETVVTLTLSEREAGLLKAITNALNFSSVDGAFASAEDVASGLPGSPNTITALDRDALDGLCGELHHELSRALSVRGAS